MADADNNFQPSKKRAAGVQLSQDNPGLDNHEETSEEEAGTFNRASDEVLATRKIVKVCLQQTPLTPSAPDPPPASNPFGGIHLVPSASAPLVEVEVCSVVGKETEQIDKNDGQSENAADEAAGESSADNKVSQKEIDESEVNFNSEKDRANIFSERTISEPAAEKVAGENSGNGAREATEADSSENDARKDVESKSNEEDKGDKELTTGKNADTASFSSFKQLSSSQNAFSGLAGTGFSSTPFSFGSMSKDGPLLGSTTCSLFGPKNDQPSFGFGTSNNGNSSVFETSGTSKTDGEKFPSMQEVPVETGEENEKAVFTADSVLFEFVDGAWKERGKGELKVNVSTTGTGKARLIMRARGNYRLILNASLFPDMKLTNMEKKGITFACVNSASEGKDGLSTIALKFKDASLVEDFRAAVMEHKTNAAASLKTPENSPKASDG